MARLDEIVKFLDGELRVAEVPDYEGALNGLQLENGGEVARVAAAVDASLPVVREAAEGGAGLLVVHHGMFWQGARAVTGAFHEKLRVAMEAGMAVYSAHIPLDIHPELGNNALLAREIGMEQAEPFFEWKGVELGLRAGMDLSLDDLLGRVEKAVGGKAVACRGGGERAGTVGLITGGAGSEVEAMAAAGIDTFITGEGPHWSFPLAEELGMNVIHAGHYATETFGARAVAETLAGRFGVESFFVDRPTGL